MTKIPPQGSPPRTNPNATDSAGVDAPSMNISGETDTLLSPQLQSASPAASALRPSPVPPHTVQLEKTQESHASASSILANTAQVVRRKERHVPGDASEDVPADYSPSRALPADCRQFLGLDPSPPIPANPRTFAEAARAGARGRPAAGVSMVLSAPGASRTDSNEIKKTIDFRIQTLNFSRRHAEPLGFAFPKASDTHLALNLDHPLLARLFLEASPDLKRSTMEALTGYDPMVTYPLRSPNFIHSIKRALSCGIRVITRKDGAEHVRADTGFMLMLARHESYGRHFGAAIVHSPKGAVEAMIELIKNEQYVAMPVMIDAVAEISRLVVGSYHPQNVSSLKAAGRLVMTYMQSIHAGKGKRAGQSLAAMLGELSAKRATNDPIRGCLVGIFIAGALSFSEYVTAKDERHLELYSEFNEGLWGGLASIAFPGVAAVTKVFEIATREIIKKAYTVRDFKGAIMGCLADIKMQILTDQATDLKLSMNDCLSVDDFIKGTLMHWIDVALNANGFQ